MPCTCDNAKLAIIFPMPDHFENMLGPGGIARLLPCGHPCPICRPGAPGNGPPPQIPPRPGGPSFGFGGDTPGLSPIPRRGGPGPRRRPPASTPLANYGNTFSMANQRGHPAVEQLNVIPGETYVGQPPPRQVPCVNRDQTYVGGGGRGMANNLTHGFPLRRCPNQPLAGSGGTYIAGGNAAPRNQTYNATRPLARQRPVAQSTPRNAQDTVILEESLSEMTESFTNGETTQTSTTMSTSYDEGDELLDLFGGMF